MAITEPQLRTVETGTGQSGTGPSTVGNRAEVTAGAPHVGILTDRCAGCQECVVRCPTGALTMDTVLWVAEADSTLCVGCRQCTRTCPFSAITVTGPRLVAPRSANPDEHLPMFLGAVTETRHGFASLQEACAEAARCLQCPDLTCVRGCPAHNDIPGFIAALRQGDLSEAHELLRATTVMPDICSRVCNQAAQCEGACTWALAGAEPVAIGRLERFVADNALVPPPGKACAPGAPGLGMHVAIVGSGPAGAGAAWVLLESGASVTVYEKDATPGGLCDWGIPDFTLPAHVAARPWEQLTEAGVVLRCQTEIGAAQLDELLCAYDAVILAHGASEPLRLGVPGSDLQGVVDATTFLKGAKQALRPGGQTGNFLSSLGLPPLGISQMELGAPTQSPGATNGSHGVPRVLVLGAGNTAMDVARTARRLGCAAVCVDWVDERFALARPDEVAEARREGIEVRFLRTVSSLEGRAGRVCRARLARTEQHDAAQRPKIVRAEPEVVEVDLVVMAMGYRVDTGFAQRLPGTPVRRTNVGVPDRSWLASGVLAPTVPGKVAVGRLSLGREVALEAAMFQFRPRVWVAGDALTGPSTVVEAMAQGRRAALALLDARPRKPGHPDLPGFARSKSKNGNGNGTREANRPLRALVCYESGGGRTAAVAGNVASSLR
ncbi:MAG TPA: FAD-dependent oxidoreductase, partial [Acidimicrobiales bacterium]|nr:FAD-dependent oxidoreductase [Acidimicrobiales bacterium]